MDREKFETLVVEAIDNLPLEFRNKLENVDVIVEDWPTSRQLKEVKLSHRSQLLGLYQGVPQTNRGRGYGLVPPDKISIFRKPIEGQCHSNEEIGVKITEVVCHEIAHHFGIDERTLRSIEDKKYRKRI
ncbi:MAG: metallopeptidase family protein [Dehalococcoidales bacterium]|nr:metallopeptidase family protein [Dehalococcoidales bacterium]